jgi:tetratricopeptide (TPR) repeat protein
MNRAMKRVWILLILLLMQVPMNSVHAQSFRECQRQFESLLRRFNQSFEENNPQISQSATYRSDLIALQKAYRTYDKTYFNPADSLGRATNEALLNVLAGNYGKALHLLSSVDTLHAQTSYYLGLLHLLNHRYGEAIPYFEATKNTKWASLNELVALGKNGKIQEGIQFGQTVEHRATQGKWNYNLGLFYKKDQQLENSVTELSAAIRQHDQMAYRLLRGDVLMKTRQSKRAVADFEKVAKRHPKAQIRYANVLVDLKRYDEARHYFEAYLESEHRTYRKDALLGLGNTYYGLNQLDNAHRYYRLATPFFKGNPVALCGQANVLVGKHEYERAQTIYNRILEQDSTYLSARLGRGVARYGQGKYALAMEDFNRASSLFDPTDRSQADLFVCRGFASYYLHDAVKALADFETAVKLDGTRYEALAGISGILIDQKNYPQAGRYLSRALLYEKKYDKMWSNYGNLLLHFDMYGKGYDVFKKAIALNPTNVKAQNGWGVVLLEDDRLDQAKVLFDSLVKENPTTPYLINNRGIVNAYHGNRFEQKRQSEAANAQYQLAFDDFKLAMDVAPTRKFYHVNQGNVYRYYQQYDEAKLSYKAYQDKSALNNTAVLYAGLEKYNDAKYYLETALQLDSSHHVFQFNMNLLVKGKQKEFARSLARAVASTDGTEGLFSDIGIKYSRDGFVTIYLYDYEYDTLHFPGRHFLPLPVAEYEEEFFIPEYDFRLMPLSEKKKKEAKKGTPTYKSQKVRLKGGSRRSGTHCPILR